MKLGVKDRRVIAAFLDGRSSEGHKLSTNGKRLDGHWMGGSDIAHHASGQWAGGITFSDLGSKAAQTIQKAIIRMSSKRHAPKRRRHRTKRPRHFGQPPGYERG